MAYIIINGPNLNLLGVREPDVYGSEGFDTYLATLRDTFPDIGLEYYQSNSEGALVDQLHEVGFSYDGIVLNAGAYTHTSVALADAVAAISSPVVEVHISNVYAREAFRHRSYLSPHVAGIILGCGLDGYRLALDYLINTPEQIVGT